MEKTKVCVWLDSDLHTYLNEARGEELTIPQYIRLILKQKMKSARKRKHGEAVPMDLYGFSTITSDLVPDDLKECAELIEEWWPIRKKKGAVNSTRVARRIFDTLRSFPSQDRKKALENAITGGWKNIYEVKNGYKSEEPKNHPAQKVFKASDSDMPPTLKELGLNKAMNGENIGGIE